MRLILVLVGVGLLLGLPGAAAGEPQEAAKTVSPARKAARRAPLVRVGKKVITVGEVSARINQQSPYIRGRYTTIERKKEFLDSLVRFEVLAAEAARRGYAKDEEVVRTIKQVMIQKLMKDEFDNKVKVEDFTEDQCRRFYEEHRDEYNKPEEVRVSHVLVESEAKAKEVLARYRELLARDPDQGAKHFRDLVKRYSTADAEDKGRGGDLGFFAVTEVHHARPVVAAAFKLRKEGEVSAPVKADDGWHVLKLTGRRKALTRSFDEVKRMVQNRLYRDRRVELQDRFVDGLTKKAQVQRFEARLADVEVEAGAPLPPHRDEP